MTTYKADEINEFPFLVYTADAGTVFDPNGAGGEICTLTIKPESHAYLIVYDPELEAWDVTQEGSVSYPKGSVGVVACDAGYLPCEAETSASSMFQEIGESVTLDKYVDLVYVSADMQIDAYLD